MKDVEQNNNTAYVISRRPVLEVCGVCGGYDEDCERCMNKRIVRSDKYEYFMGEESVIGEAPSLKAYCQGCSIYGKYIYDEKEALSFVKLLGYGDHASIREYEKHEIYK